MTVALQMTDQAAAKVWELMLEDGKPELKLRVYIEGGGCSGLQYKFAFTEEKQIDDLEVIKPIADGQVYLLVDQVSYMHLAGAEIDYQEDIEGSRFIIHNPNAVTTCGCGSSFSMD